MNETQPPPDEKRDAAGQPPARVDELLERVRRRNGAIRSGIPRVRSRLPVPRPGKEPKPRPPEAGPA